MGVNQKQKLVIEWAGTIPSNQINATPSYQPAPLKSQAPNHHERFNTTARLHWLICYSKNSYEELISHNIYGYHELLPLSILINLLLFIYLYSFAMEIQASILNFTAESQSSTSACKSFSSFQTAELLVIPVASSWSCNGSAPTQCFSANSVVIWTFTS